MPVLPPLEWRRPSQVNPAVPDIIEVAADGPRVLIRSSLGLAVRNSPGAFADFIRAAKAGEYDNLLPTAP
ncbi:DUF397 domain-containing protein [Parafrankia colletiae]|uniref:DUF397 domain-containing protein n=2 Tax=Parafrankia colletiae TaxID=573497 RepID=A0A1S1Q9W6_9ACTN|nr:DUF397 domain-containing protein [Parafrankia colletiae]